MHRRSVPRAALLLAFVLVTGGGGLVVAKDEPPAGAAKDKAAPDGPSLRYAKVYADALAEAKDRGCALFLTFHGDG